MGLFSRKKEEPKGLPLPEFPKIPESEDMKFPSYEPNIEAKNIKNAIESLSVEKEIPQIQKPMLSKQSFCEEKDIPIPLRKPLIKPNMVQTKEPMKIVRPLPRPEEFKQGKQNPVYVKMNDYKQSLENIELIKNRLDEAVCSLEKLEKIKEDENNELNEWKQMLAKIKEELYSIDQKLFKEI